MNVITRLLSYQPFLDRVVRDIRSAAAGQETSIRTVNGEVTGEVKELDLLGAPLFVDEGCECVGHTCSLPFSGRGEVNGYGESSAGDGWLPFAAPVEYFGHVDLSWPDDGHVQTQEDFRAIYPNITVNVVVESIGGRGSETLPQKPAPTPAR